MTMPGRTYNAGNEYRYGFNGKENDKDISEVGQDYGLRIYDSRLGRFLSVDPITDEYPELTPYQFASNRPIDGIDVDGKEWCFAFDWILYDIFVKPFNDAAQGCVKMKEGIEDVNRSNTGQSSFQNENVPKYVQAQLANSEKVAGATKIVEGFTEFQVATVEIATNLTPMATETIFGRTVSTGAKYSLASIPKAKNAKYSLSNVKSFASKTTSKLTYQTPEFIDEGLRMIEQPLKPLTAKVSQKTSLMSAINATGKSNTELGTFFGWQTGKNSKAASSFTKAQLEEFGLSKEHLENLAKGYRETATASPNNPSAAIRAEQLESVIKNIFGK